MQRASYWTEIAIITAATLPVLTTGCSRDNSLASDSGRTAMTRAAVDQGLPEIVVSARKPGPGTMAMSTPNATAAEGMSASRVRRP